MEKNRRSALLILMLSVGFSVLLCGFPVQAKGKKETGKTVVALSQDYITIDLYSRNASEELKQKIPTELEVRLEDGSKELVAITWKLQTVEKRTTNYNSTIYEAVLPEGYIKSEQCNAFLAEINQHLVTKARASGKTAFAVYSSGDHSLRFYKRNSVPSKGSRFNGLIVTEVYTGVVENNYLTSVIHGNPWMLDNYETPYITKVVVEDEIQPLNLSHYFYSLEECAYFDVEKMDTSGTTAMDHVFDRTGQQSMSAAQSSYRIIGMDEWNTSKVKTMECMFNAAGFYAGTWEIGDLSTKTVTKSDGSSYLAWDVSNVRDSFGMYAMFGGAAYSAKAVYIGDLSTWDVSKVIDMRQMFRAFAANSKEYGMGSLASWNVSNVKYMDQMFWHSGIRELDLTNWNTSHVQTVSEMFDGMNYLEKIVAGENFSFAAIYDRCMLPTPNPAYIEGVNGKWACLEEDRLYTVSEIPITVNTPTTYVADKDHVIQYDGNGNDGGSMKNSTHSIYVSTGLNENKYTKDYYDFMGWNTKADGSGDFYADRDKVRNLAKSGETVRLYAQWKAKEIQVIYDENSLASDSKQISEAITIEDCLDGYQIKQNTGFTNFTKANAKFRAWDLNRDILASKAAFQKLPKYISFQELISMARTVDAEGRISLTFFAAWDYEPEVECKNRFFTLYEARKGRITQEELLRTVKTSDRENEITLIAIKDYDESIFRSLSSDTIIVVTCVVEDAGGNRVEKDFDVCITDTNVAEDEGEENEETGVYSRFIGVSYWDKSAEEGGPEEDSLWRTEPSYRSVLQHAMQNTASGDGYGHVEQCWVFEQSDIESVKLYVEEHGIGNAKADDALGRFVTHFISCRKE